MPNLFVILLIIFSFSLISYPTSAAITIQRMGDKTYPTIQRALDAAIAGDIILISGETCTGAGNGYNINWPNTNNLTLRGKSTTETVVSAEALGRVIKVGYAVNLTIEALTIKDGIVNGNGAGIYLTANSKLWLKNITCKNCTAKGHSILAGTGGAIRSSGSYVYARDCAFINNTATFNGGVACGGRWDAFNCVFNGNSSGRNGGVAWQGIWKATNCILYSNTARAAGGVAELEKWETVNCIFDNNSALYGGVAWSGIWNVSNCTLYINNSPNGGVARGTTLNATNCIFWGSNNQFDGVSGLMKYCDIQGGGFGNLTLKECISENPLFKDVKARDLSLKVNSPCIDTGTIEGAPSKDITGKERPYPPNTQNLFYDMGAYEFYRPTYDIYVSSTGNDSNTGKSDSPLKTIQRALDLVSEGRTIFLNKGRYEGPVDNWPKYIQDITIKSLSGTWEDTVVSGNGANAAFDLSSVPSEIRGVIEGVTITAGGTAEAGRGILLPKKSNIILKNCLLKSASAVK